MLKNTRGLTVLISCTLFWSTLSTHADESSDYLEDQSKYSGEEACRAYRELKPLIEAIPHKKVGLGVLASGIGILVEKAGRNWAGRISAAEIAQLRLAKAISENATEEVVSYGARMVSKLLSDEMLAEFHSMDAKVNIFFDEKNESRILKAYFKKAKSKEFLAILRQRFLRAKFPPELADAFISTIRELKNPGFQIGAFAKHQYQMDTYIGVLAGKIGVAIGENAAKRLVSTPAGIATFIKQSPQIISDLAKKAFAAKCVRVGGAVLKLAGIISGVATDLFTSSPASPMTRDEYFRANPSHLYDLDITEQEACSRLKQDEILRNRFMLSADLFKEKDPSTAVCDPALDGAAVADEDANKNIHHPDYEKVRKTLEGQGVIAK